MSPSRPTTSPGGTAWTRPTCASLSQTGKNLWTVRVLLQTRRRRYFLLLSSPHWQKLWWHLGRAWPLVALIGGTLFTQPASLWHLTQEQWQRPEVPSTEEDKSHTPISDSPSAKPRMDVTKGVC